MDYLDFYGLEQEPFSTAPISRFYFNSAQHQRALVRLMYAVDTMKGLAVLIGDLGTGKTTLARRMLDNLPEEEYESALLVIIHSGITADWLLSRIARQLGVEDPAPEKLKLLNQLYSRLVELHEEGKKAVVLIDEAQMLQSKEIMEEFRGMLNLELPESKLVTFVFFGLPELEEYLHLDEPLAQRVTLKCNLENFTFESTQGYINHRLRLAGAKHQLFPNETIKLIHQYSKGIPRLINTICDNSLFEGYLLKKKNIEPELVMGTATDLGLAPTPKPRRAPRPAGPAAQVIQVQGHQPPPQAEPETFPEEVPRAAVGGVPEPPPVVGADMGADFEGVSIEAVDEDSGEMDLGEISQPGPPPLSADDDLASLMEDSTPPSIEEDEEEAIPLAPDEPPSLEDDEDEVIVDEEEEEEGEDDVVESMFGDLSDEPEPPSVTPPPVAAAPPPPPPPPPAAPQPPPTPAPPPQEESEDLDSMFNGITEPDEPPPLAPPPAPQPTPAPAPQPQPEPEAPKEEGEDIDSLLDSWDDE